MSNTWFQFKQFRIEQGQTAMKVGTDGVLLGAWTNIVNSASILDIGTGTGLIALMLAQRNPIAKIVALEIDYKASVQAQENINNSEWAHRIKVLNQSIQIYSEKNNRKFDLIVSNPPFFELSYASINKQRQLARHTDTLSFDELLYFAQKHLNSKGIFSVILPGNSQDYFIKKAKKTGFFLEKKTSVFPTQSSLNPKRSLLSFKLEPTKTQIDTLIIEPYKRHEYSTEYIELVKDFYLD